MKSTVKKLFDIKQVEVPAQMCAWHVKPDEEEVQLARIAAAHPVELFPDTVETGDSVLCRTESADNAWKHQAVPIYPGRGMVLALENAVLGMKLGEQRTVDGITLDVVEIIRRRPGELTDELIRSEGIDGVETVEQYRSWWKTHTEQERKSERIRQIAYFIQETVVANSQFVCDEEELATIGHDMARKQYDAMVASGIDPTIPEDGVDFLTEEEALEKIVRENEPRLKGGVVNAYYATVVQPITDNEFNQAMDQFAQSMGKTREALLEYAGEFLVNDYIYGQVFLKDLFAYAETLLED